MAARADGHLEARDIKRAQVPYLGIVSEYYDPLQALWAAHLLATFPRVNRKATYTEAIDAGQGKEVGRVFRAAAEALADE